MERGGSCREQRIRHMLLLTDIPKTAKLCAVFHISVCTQPASELQDSVCNTAVHDMALEVEHEMVAR